MIVQVFKCLSAFFKVGKTFFHHASGIFPRFLLLLALLILNKPRRHFLGKTNCKKGGENSRPTQIRYLNNNYQICDDKGSDKSSFLEREKKPGRNAVIPVLP